MALGRGAKIRGVQLMASPSRNYLLEMFAEFSRAVAAAHRYEDLRYRSASHGKIAPDDISRRIFAEFYAVGEAVEARRPEAPARQPSTAKAIQQDTTAAMVP
jgi:hypothetical protein